MAVEFRLLGSVEARLDGRRIDTGPPQQQCVLVALLVEADEPVPADQLVERVWGHRIPHRAKETLRSYLSRLRRVLAAGGVGIPRRSSGYVLTADSMTVDLHRFRELVRQARTAGDPEVATSLFDQALGLWRGEAFSGLETPWLNGVRNALDAERVAAELDLTDLLLRQGRHGELLATLSAQVADRPLDERLAGQLMLALYRSGRQAEALDYFRRLWRRLADELGVDPGPQLQELHQRILTTDPALAAGRPGSPTRSPRLRQLPGSIPNFVGRTAELDQLTARLDTASHGRGTVVITSISGLPGIGKTSLAVHWARHHLDWFPDGQLYVNLRGFDPSGTPVDPAEAIRGFLDAFEVPAQNVPTELAVQAALYRSLVEGKQMVIVLDNARDTDQVRPLLPGSPSCLVLVTSRHQLTGLVVRDHAQRITLDMLATVEARELLTSFLGKERVAAEADAVEEIIRRCAHLPLALSIAAARAGTDPALPLSALVAELRQERETLAALSTRDSQDTDLRTVFSWSYRALSAPAARLFRLLGLHPGPDIGSMAAACLADLPEPEARELFVELTQLNLLRKHKAGRYQLHDLLRSYAGELAGDDEREAATHRFLDYYLHATSLAMEKVDPRGGTAVSDIADPPRHAPVFPDREQAGEWLDAEYPNLIAATTYAVRHGWYRHAWRLPHLLQYYFDIRGRLHDWISSHLAALTAARNLEDEHAQAEVLKFLGIAYWLAGRSEEALEHSREALVLYRRAGDRAGEGDMLNNLGLVYERTGQYEEALDHYQQALPLRLAVGNQRGEGATLQNLGNLYDLLGRYDEAVSHYHRALAIFRDRTDERSQAIVLGNLGIVHESMGNYDEAVECLQQSCALVEKSGDQRVAANFMTALGSVYRKLGRHAEAIDHHRRSLELIQDIGDHATESAILNNLGDTHLAVGEDEQALAYHQQALALARDGRYRQEEAKAHNGIGLALAATNPAAAQDHWRQALTIYDQLGVPEANEVRDQLARM
jgi:DNA-binding SARP family transcriptional activator/tetratricopeptide (TPR) repeat protein